MRPSSYEITLMRQVNSASETNSRSTVEVLPELNQLNSLRQKFAYETGLILQVSQVQGGTLYPSIRGVGVNIWGVRFYKKIVLGVCELQFRKKSIFEVWEPQLKKNSMLSALRIESKVAQETKF